MKEGKYRNLYKTGKLKERIEILFKILESCQLCPRRCNVNRLKNEYGFCKSGVDVVVSSAGPHFGEEPELVGRYGSGTIFFSGCNLGCIYCQNYEISHYREGEIITEEELAQKMLELQKAGCHNINFVTPTHFVPQIIKAVKIAAGNGLFLPLVYNCGGYENVDVIKLLDGIIDIYMPDIKYSDNSKAKEYSGIEDYFERCKESVKEMFRQVGDLKITDGIAERGLLIRHLVLPGDISGSKEVFRFIAEEISKNTYVNIMDQYRPCFKAKDYPEINRRITYEEFNYAIEQAKKAGLNRIFF